MRITKNPSVLPKNYVRPLIALGVIVTLGFSAIVASVMWESRDQERERARLAATNVIAAMSSEIDRNLELYDLSLQAVVEGLKLPALSKLTPELRQLVLFDRAATAKDMGSIFVLDKNGTVTTDSRTLTPKPYNYADRDFFKSQIDGLGDGPYLSRPFIAPNGEYVIAISRRLTDANGAFAGVVVGTLRLSYFHKMFLKLKLGENDAITLVRDDGSLLMRSPFRIDAIGRNLADNSIFDRAVAYPSGSFESVAQIDGVKRLYAFQHVGDQSIYLIYGTSLDSIYSPWQQRAWRIGLIMLLVGATNITLFMFLIRALKRRGEAEYQLSIIAKTDGLTRLCNRRHLDTLFDAAWARAMSASASVALLMIDADHFKTYNDQFGHQAGDAALLAIADCIAHSTRNSANISARYGGEEFAVLMPDASLADALFLAKHIQTNIATLRADQQGRPDSTPTISIGAGSVVPREGLLPRDLIAAADAALYLAKHKGRNRTEPTITLAKVAINTTAAA